MALKYRWAENHYERMPELVSRHVAVIAARKALCLSARETLRCEASEAHRGGSTMQCECSEQNCPVHPGRSQCDSEMTVTLFRVDTDDQTGTARCDGCARDALDSGLFVTEDDF